MSLTLTPAEIEEITDLRQAAAQLKRLHERGFARAYVVGGVVKLERAHYEAVCRGEFARGAIQADTSRPKPQPFRAAP